jgi:hypothetical protein
MNKAKLVAVLCIALSVAISIALIKKVVEWLS